MKLTLQKDLFQWVKYDDDGKELYTIQEKLGNIFNVKAPDDKIPDTIVLPGRDEDLEEYINNKLALKLSEKYKAGTITDNEIDMLFDYVLGNYKVDSLLGLSNKYNSYKLIIPAQSSIRFNPWCFTNCSTSSRFADKSNTDVSVELVLPEDMALKFAYIQFDGHPVLVKDSFLLVTHKDFNVKLKCEEGAYLIVKDYKNVLNSANSDNTQAETMYAPCEGFPTIIISKDKLMERDVQFAYKTADEIKNANAGSEDNATRTRK